MPARGTGGRVPEQLGLQVGVPELHGSGVSVNALGTAGLVLTPGVAVVSPHTPDNAPVEPDDAMADAALRLCCAPPGEVTGRIAYSMELLGRPCPDGPWALPATF